MLSFDDTGILYTPASEKGLAKSSDMGKSWTKIDKPDLTIMSIATDSQNGVFYVAGYSPNGLQEVFKSSNDGSA